MATQAAGFAYHGALTANEEEIINFTGAYRNVRITNWGATTDIVKFTLGPTAGQGKGPAAVAVADTTNCYQLRGAAAVPTAVREFVVPTTGALTVRLISGQTPALSIETYPGAE